jgi:hypothetical protein
LDDLRHASLFFYDQGDTLLYFDVDRAGGYGGQDIWAIRLVNGAWSEPFNLGPVINSTVNEAGPSMPDDGSRLYFTRAGEIVYSDIINGQFTEPDTLPSIINSDLNESYPKISRDGQRLYFRRYGTYYLPDTFLVSYFTNGQWEEPFPLNNNVNCNHIDPNCPMSPCASYGPSFTGDGTKMYFTHFVAYGQFCEPGWDILASELVTDIDSPSPLVPSAFTLSAYPNPFNSATNISIDGNIEAVSEVAIYDITGRRIRSFEPASRITWDGADSRGKPVSSGIYFVKATAADFETSLRITLLK